MCWEFTKTIKSRALYRFTPLPYEAHSESISNCTLGSNCTHSVMHSQIWPKFAGHSVNSSQRTFTNCTTITHTHYCLHYWAIIIASADFITATAAGHHKLRLGRHRHRCCGQWRCHRHRCICSVHIGDRHDAVSVGIIANVADWRRPITNIGTTAAVAIHHTVQYFGRVWRLRQ